MMIFYMKLYLDIFKFNEMSIITIFILQIVVL